jgi:superfamily II DNA or RNA helicase
VSQRVAELLAGALSDGAPASVRDLLAAVRARGGARVPRALIERTLADDGRFVGEETNGRKLWRLLDDDASEAPGADDRAKTPAIVQPADGTRDRLDALALRPWQAEALAAWSASCRGVVEAVTGTGKTRLAMAAVRVVVDRGGRSLVLVPTLELQDQWVRELRCLLPGVHIGRLGGGHADDLWSHEVVVATVHSAAALPIAPPPDRPGLLVADEAHRYGAPSWAAALAPAFGLRLALTATYERNDDGLVEVLAPYFGEAIVRYGYDRAVADGTLAPFRIALAGVRLDPAERAGYDRADARARQLHRELVGGHGLPQDPNALFAAVAAVVARGDAGAGDRPLVRACREYLVRVRERREIAATAAGKLRVCAAAAPGLRGRRTLVFTDTIEQADAATRVLVRGGLAAETVHGELTAQRRRIRLARFRRGDLDALVAPRVLDEGVDVPDADVALVLAGFRTRRQLIQRLGRVLRRKPDDREARLVLAHALRTREDPARGGHDDFLRQIRDVATEVVALDVDAEPSALRAWVGTGPGAPAG